MAAGIDTYDDAVAAILARSAWDRGFISNPFAGDAAAQRGLARTRAVLDRLGNPERACPIVHVAGSKGKGSTCVFVDAILRASGRTTGRYLSPHLHSWRERIAVDDEPVSEAVFTALTRDVITAAEAVESAAPALGEVTAFELTTAMALLRFQRAGCEVAVLEVGLGGTLDATNVVTPAVAVITPLDFEHTAILGDTMAEIAANKAGIIKPGVPVVSAAQPDDGLAVIRRRAADCAAPLQVIGDDWIATGTDRHFAVSGPSGVIERLHTSIAGWHQVQNATLAIAAVYALGWSDIGDDAIRAGIAGASLPGRFEQVKLDTGQVVILDGAHTGSAATVLAATLRDRFPGASTTIVIGMLRDKHPDAILSPLLDVAAHWIAVTPDSPRALPAVEVETVLTALDMNATRATSVADGIAAATAGGHPVILVTGSLTTVAEARIALGLG